MGRKIGITPEDTAQRIRDAAIAVVVERGLRAVSSRSVAAKANTVPSTVVANGGMPTIWRILTAAAFAPLMVEFAKPGTMLSPLGDIQKSILTIIKQEEGLASLITQVCGLAHERPRREGDLNGFQVAVTEATKQLALAARRDRRVERPSILATKLVTFYIGAAVQIMVWPTIDDERILSALA